MIMNFNPPRSVICSREIDDVKCLSFFYLPFLRNLGIPYRRYLDLGMRPDPREHCHVECESGMLAVRSQPILLISLKTVGPLEHRGRGVNGIPWAPSKSR